MACSIAGMGVGGRAAAILWTAVALLVASGSAGIAQTLTDPNAQQNWPRPAAKAKPHAGARLNSCDSFGPGFVNVPGTDACIKVGGWADVDGAASR